MAAFSGIRVLDLAWVVAGPVVGRVLADYGAEVIRLESRKRIDTARVVGPFPKGVTSNQNSALFHNCNAGKLGLSLDFSHNDAQQIILDLVAESDVLVESFSPGQMEKWGLTYERLRAVNPKLIMVSTSLMGQEGPYKSMAGFGSTGSAMAGFQSLSGEDKDHPVGPYGPYTDYLAPRIILTSLFSAFENLRHTGEGCYLDIAQSDAGLIFQAPEIAHFGLTGEEPGLSGNRSESMAPHGVFRCRDGVWIAIAIRDDRDWRSLLGLLPAEVSETLASFSNLRARKENETFIEEHMGRWTAGFDGLGLQDQMQGRGIPAHVLNSFQSFATDEQIVHLQHLVGLKTLDGSSMAIEGSRYFLSESKPSATRAAPNVGQDNHEVLTKLLGYSQDKVDALNASGVLT